MHVLTVWYRNWKFTVNSIYKWVCYVHILSSKFILFRLYVIKIKYWMYQTNTLHVYLYSATVYLCFCTKSFFKGNGGFKLLKQWSIIWHIWIFRYMQLKRVQKCHLGTGIIIRHSVPCMHRQKWIRTVFDLNTNTMYYVFTCYNTGQQFAYLSPFPKNAR